ncbi:unnamed protein product [Caenorhabditis sp. 36 PRJEB53466]|nr:unnamed protein product [Caenorhabditis sp. 36 PRJEB53466]
MKRTFRGPFIFILGVTFSGFIFSMHYTRSRELTEQRSVSRMFPDASSPVLPPSSATDQSSCECVSEATGKKYHFCYVDPQNPQSVGKKFDCAHLKHLEKLNLVENPGPFVNLSDSIKNEQEVVFCSAVSDNHFNEGTHSLASLRQFYPKRKYIIYGLDLNNLYADYFKKDANVEYRHFNTSGYPEYVGAWMEYRFKPLILAEVMKEHASIWWMDAHIAVKKPNMTNELFREIAENRKNASQPLPSPIVFFIHASHSNFAVMFPQLLDYFPSNSVPLLKNEEHGSQLGANTFYVARTEYTVKIFKWWILCALDKTCMSPPGSQVFCRFGSNRFDVFANCYRFDQSVINLLLLNDFQDHHKYYSKLGYLF